MSSDGERRFRQSLRRLRAAREKRKGERADAAWLEKAWPWLFRLLVLVAAALLADRLGDSSLIIKLVELVSG